MKAINGFNLLLLFGVVACATPSMPPEETAPSPNSPPPAELPSELQTQVNPPIGRNAGEMEGDGGAGFDVHAGASKTIDEPVGEAAKGAMTAQERVSVLEEKLDKQLIEFDGLLLNERMAVKAESQDKAADDFNAAERLYGRADGITDIGRSGDLPPPLPLGADDEAPLASGGGSLPGRPPEARRGDYEHGAVAPAIPADIPRGEEKDVVARQLREAALQETDPELRRKLWDEYRRYKGLPVKR